MLSEEAKIRNQRHNDEDQLRRLERIMRERKDYLVPSEAARIQLAINDLKRKLAA